MPATSSNHDQTPLDKIALKQQEIDRHRGRFVPWIIAAFYLSFMSALISFVVIAYQHPPNEVTSNAYQKGLEYNATLDKADAQKALGWSSDITFRDNRLNFQLFDAQHHPIPDAEVRVWFIRPSMASEDRSHVLNREGTGYSVRPDLPSQGLWQVRVTAEANGHVYQAADEIEAK